MPERRAVVEHARSHDSTTEILGVVPAETVNLLLEFRVEGGQVGRGLIRSSSNLARDSATAASHNSGVEAGESGPGRSDTLCPVVIERGFDSDPPPPVVRVGIVSWNTAEMLDACLRALPAALAGIDAEVVVVDNGSSDDSVAVARRRGVTVVANPDNRGYAVAMNQALAGRTPVLLALNPDTVPPPGSLARLTRILLDGPPDVGLVVPRLLNPDGTEQHSVRTFGSPLAAAAAWFLPRRVLRRGLGPRFWLDGLAPHERAQDIDWAIGAVHVIRSSALAGRPAPYDTRWFMYVEDVEICWELRARGWRCRLEPSVEVVHHGNAAGAKRWGSTRTRIYMEATYDWYARDRGQMQARAWALVNVVGSIYWSGSHLLAGWLFRDQGMRRDARSIWQELPVHMRGLARPLR